MMVEPRLLLASTAGISEYRLTAMVSHLSANSLSGHYIAHVLSRDQWYTISDQQVTIKVFFQWCFEHSIQFQSDIHE